MQRPRLRLSSLRDVAWNQAPSTSPTMQVAVSSAEPLLSQAQDSVLCVICYYCFELITILLKKFSFNDINKNTMSTRYKFIDNASVYFITSTVAGWTDIFTREIYKTILLDSIRHCQQSQGLKIHAWVLMTNHLHTICSCKEGHDLGLIWRNIKSFTAMKLIDAVINNSKESRKEYLPGA